MADIQAKGRETTAPEPDPTAHNMTSNNFDGAGQRAHAEAATAVQNGRNAATAGVQALHGGTETALRGFEEIASNAAEQTRRTTGSVKEAMEVHRETVRSASEDFRAATTAAALSAERLVDIDAAVFDLMGQTTEATARVSQRLLASRTPREAAHAQQEYTQTLMRSWLDGSMLILKATQDFAGKALGPINERVEQRARA